MQRNRIGKVLISEPFLTDPSFSRSVVLIVDDDAAGVTGFVLNNHSEIKVHSLVEGLPYSDNVAYVGGPVEPDSLHYIHCKPGITGCRKVQEGLYWGGDFEMVCKNLSSGEYRYEDFVFLIGYSGWAPGQLNDEIADKAWLEGTVPSEVIFDRQFSSEELWKLAIRNQGGRDALLANAPSDPFLN